MGLEKMLRICFLQARVVALLRRLDDHIEVAAPWWPERGEALSTNALSAARCSMSSGSWSPLVTNPSPTATDYEPDVLSPSSARSR